MWIFFIIPNIVSGKPIKADSIFDNPNNTMVKLSPSGKFISIHYIKEKNHDLRLLNSKTFVLESTLSLGNDNVLNDYYWLNEQQLFINVTHEGRRVNFIGNLVNGKIKPSIIEAEGYLVHYLPEEPGKLMFAKKKNNKSHQLLVVSIESLLSNDFDNAFEVKHNNNRINHYYFDNNSKRVITSDYDKKNKSIVIRFVPLYGGKWETIISLKNTDYNLKPLDFITDESIAVLTNKNSDKMVLRSYDIKAKKLGKVIYQHPKYDLVSAGFTSEGILDFVTFKQHGLNQKLFFDKGKAHYRKRLAKTFVNQEVYIIDRVVEKEISLLYVNGSDEPGQYYIYDKQADEAVTFIPSYTNLLEQKFFPSQQLTIKADDGIELEAFLTLPEGIDHSTLLVMPHGGPIDVQESDRFNKYVQYYVSRGFTVLRVNFRGSAGFGKEFLEKGVGEFGKDIEQDITAAVARVKQSHTFKYQCAMGSSYGGYSSTMLAIKHPEKYDCVIASFGVYDLPLLFNASNYRSGKEYQKFIEKTVGKFDESLSLVSPVYLAKKLKAPILLIAGRDDDVADFEHTNRFKYILNKLNHPTEIMFYEKTGHGHRFWGGDIHEAAISYDFLMRTLNLPSSSPKELDEISKQAIANDYAVIADGYNFKDYVDDDEIKAFKYYQKAAIYSHPRANFNIGSHYHTGDQVNIDLDKAVEYYRNSAKLGYAGAHARIGRMYMEGEHLSQNWQTAVDSLLSAKKLKDNPLNNIRLARFYCVSPEKFRNIGKCLELMDLAQYERISKRVLSNAKQHIREALAWIFSSAQLNKEEKNKLKKFAIDTFELTTTDISLDEIRSGQFEFIESDVFGKNGEYSLLPKSGDVLASDDEEARFGLIFNVDIPGINESYDKVALTAQWIKTTENGNKYYPTNTILYGSPINDWEVLRSFKDIKEEATWTLVLYDFDQNLLLSQKFKVAPSRSKDIVNVNHKP